MKAGHGVPSLACQAIYRPIKAEHQTSAPLASQHRRKMLRRRLLEAFFDHQHSFMFSSSAGFHLWFSKALVAAASPNVAHLSEHHVSIVGRIFGTSVSI